MITEVHQQGRFYRLSTGRAAHYENLKPRVPSPEFRSVPQSMEGLEYLIMELACEVNKKDTREEDDDNGNMSIGEDEKVEVNSDENSFAEEDCNEPGQKELPGWTKPDKPLTMETRTGGRKKTSMRYNRYGDDFVISKIQPNKVGADMVSMGELVSDKEWKIINDNDHSWQEDHTVPEREVDLEQSEIERREITKLRILDRIHGLPADEEETLSIQQVVISAGKHVNGGNSLFGWTATDRPLDVPSDLKPASSTGMSKKFFPGSEGRTYPHQNFDDKKLMDWNWSKRRLSLPLEENSIPTSKYQTSTRKTSLTRTTTSSCQTGPVQTA